LAFRSFLPSACALAANGSLHLFPTLAVRTGMVVAAARCLVAATRVPPGYLPRVGYGLRSGDVRSACGLCEERAGLARTRTAVCGATADSAAAVTRFFFFFFCDAGCTV
jgi:hypothetical protein